MKQEPECRLLWHVTNDLCMTASRGFVTTLAWCQGDLLSGMVECAICKWQSGWSLVLLICGLHEGSCLWLFCSQCVLTCNAAAFDCALIWFGLVPMTDLQLCLISNAWPAVPMADLQLCLTSKAFTQMMPPLAGFSHRPYHPLARPQLSHQEGRLLR